MRFFLPIFILCMTSIATPEEESIRLPYLLGSSRTPLAGSSYERIHNIRLATSKINGMILNPGEEFSYNKTVGKREYSTGFLTAPAIVYEELQPVIGGGICQVSSTLFNAVLLSDLPVVERHRHHTPINYIPLGMDATISWGTKDFRFRNNSNGRIQLIGFASDSSLTFQIYGENPLRDDLKLETEINESPSPFPDRESEGGLEIALYRLRFHDGKLLEREFIHRDYFPARITKSQ